MELRCNGWHCSRANKFSACQVQGKVYRKSNMPLSPRRRAPNAPIFIPTIFALQQLYLSFGNLGVDCPALSPNGAGHPSITQTCFKHVVFHTKSFEYRAAKFVAATYRGRTINTQRLLTPPAIKRRNTTAQIFSICKISIIQQFSWFVRYFSGVIRPPFLGVLGGICRRYAVYWGPF